MASFGLGQQMETCTTSSIQIEPSTPWVAASEGNLSLLQSSLQTLNLTADAADEQGYTLLQAAASYNQRGVMKWLLQLSSINPNSVDNDGDTALHHADKVEAARLLLEVGKVDPNIINGSGKTALQVKREDLSELLVEEDEDNSDVLNLRELIEYLERATGKQ